MAEFTLRVQGGLALRDLTARLKRVERSDLSRKLRRNIQAAARPVIADLRRAVMHVQVSSSRNGLARPDTDTQLRARIARALTTSQTRRGIRIVVSARRVDPQHVRYGAALPKYLDTEIKVFQRWRHPVFGHDVWVEQRGQPWFFATINRHSTDFRRAVLAVIDDIIREIAD